MTAWSGNLPGWIKRKQKDADETDRRAQAEPNAARSGSAELTGGGGSSTDPVVVWNAPHRLEAEVVKAHLESEGIPAFIRGEAYGMITGLTVGNLAQAQVLVPGLLADKALEILALGLEDAAEDTDGEYTDGEYTDSEADGAGGVDGDGEDAGSAAASGAEGSSTRQ